MGGEIDTLRVSLGGNGGGFSKIHNSASRRGSSAVHTGQFTARPATTSTADHGAEILVGRNATRWLRL
jgi:hypothetical protein